MSHLPPCRKDRRAASALSIKEVRPPGWPDFSACERSHGTGSVFSEQNAVNQLP